jgi:UDP-N-acetyl-D-galactosamine dehydrogenase
MGLTFKENCPDMRNTRVFDVAEELNKHDMDIDAFDPWIKDPSFVNNKAINSITEPELSAYDAIIVAVGHDEFKKMGASKIKSYGKNNHILFDLKYLFSKNESDLRF